MTGGAPEVDAVWEDPERVEEIARKPPDHRLQALIATVGQGTQ